MLSSIGQLKKLSGISFRELRIRGQQEITKLTDRLVPARTREMKDHELLFEFAPHHRNGSGEGTVGLLIDRLRVKRDSFLPSLIEKEEIAGMMDRSFSVERDAIIASAEKALAGRFDLLGFSDLYFGDPVDWHFDAVSRKTAPLVHWSKIDPVNPLNGGDPKIIWELNRHAHLVTLGQAYWLTKDERFVEGFVNYISNWIEANPIGEGINWASSLEVAFRAIAWVWALNLCGDSHKLTPKFLAMLVKSFINHGRHVEKYLSYYFSPNTHLTGEALGLLYIGSAFPELRRADAWRNLGLRILLDQLPKQVRQDGVYFEQASYYHRYTADFYTHLLVLARANRIELPLESQESLREKLESLFEHLMWITRPDGTSPLFGDDDGGRLIRFASRAGNDFRDTLAVGAAIFKRGDWKSVAGDAPVEMLWLLGAEDVRSYERMKAAPQSALSRAFETSGYYVMRDGWEPNSSFVLIDCGRHGSEIGPGHAHADALSLEFVARGTTWLVDPGTFVYAADVKTRDQFRSSAAHNTVTVDGESQSVTGTPFAWRTIASCRAGKLIETENITFFEGSHDGYERLKDPVTHKRSVTFVKADEDRNVSAYLVVVDKFTAVGSHRYSIRFHFTPECIAAVRNNHIEAHHRDGSSLIIKFFCKIAFDTRIESGWVSICYGERTVAPVGLFEAEAIGPQEFLTLIIPERL